MVFSIPQIYCVSLLQRYNTPTYPANYGGEAIAIRAAESRHLRPARPADTSRPQAAAAEGAPRRLTLPGCTAPPRLAEPAPPRSEQERPPHPDVL